jgi:carbonic anhydrase
MSIFDSQSKWPAQCSTANQSPINLVQAQAKPCSLNCDLVIDSKDVSSAVVFTIPMVGGLIVEGENGQIGSLKFRGDSYVCNALQIVYPSAHSVEGIHADAEMILHLRKSTGEILCVSVLINVSPAETVAKNFFNQFIPYVNDSHQFPIPPITLKHWNIGMAIPPAAEFFTYTGSLITPACQACEWIVFEHSVNMDNSVFAMMTNKVLKGTRDMQQTGTREIFYNNTRNISGIMPNDGRMYVKLKPTGNTPMPAFSSPKQPVSLKDKTEDPNKPSTMVGKGLKGLNDQVQANGGLAATAKIGFIAILVCLGLYIGYYAASTAPFSTEWIKPWSLWTREQLGWIWDFLKGLPAILWNLTIGFFVWLTKPRPRRVPNVPELPKVPELPAPV